MPDDDARASDRSADWTGSPRLSCARSKAQCRPKTRLARPVGPYEQVGILTLGAIGAIGADGANGAAGAIGAAGPVPLYGRPAHRGSDRWNYYAVSNQHVPQKLPVFTKERDCARMMGCPEASDGDTLDVRGYGKATVTMYTRDDADRYIS